MIPYIAELNSQRIPSMFDRFIHCCLCLAGVCRPTGVTTTLPGSNDPWTYRGQWGHDPAWPHRCVTPTLLWALWECEAVPLAPTRHHGGHGRRRPQHRLTQYPPQQPTVSMASWEMCCIMGNVDKLAVKQIFKDIYDILTWTLVCSFMHSVLHHGECTASWEM